jgi:uncharacterized repeat protein (TIGR01451 family)
MKKSSVRLFTIGGFLLLGSFALALAQHDSRNRTRVAGEKKQTVAQPAVPIAVDQAGRDWDPIQESSLLVRANNNSFDSDEQLAPSPEQFENPLRRMSAYPGELPEFDVVTASATEPVDLPTPQLPSGPPSWLAGNLPGTSVDPSAGSALPPALPAGGLPKLPATAQLPNASSPSGVQSAADLVALPSFPMATSNQPRSIDEASAGGGLPALPSMVAPQAVAPQMGGVPTQAFAQTSSTAPGSSNSVSSMSDTQRQVMQPTNLQPASVLPNSGGAPGFTNPNAVVQSIAGSAANPAQYSSSPNNALPRNSELPSGISPAGVGPAPRSNNDYPPGAGAPVRPQASLVGLVSNEPGNRYLDGSQNPIMLIQKRGPEEVRVGRKATFVITVRNAGNSIAQDVTVVDSVPSGMRFAESSPPVNPTAEGLLTWKLGEMPPGDERTINLQMIPERQGELGSVASVHFAAQASVRTVATLPKLELQVDAQPESLIGGPQLIAVTVKNTGTGVARGVRLEADLPPQLRHESGDQHLEAVFPRELAPSQSERIELRLMAAQPGDAVAKVRAITEDGIQAEQSVSVVVLAPSLAATIEGPRLRYLDRQATYRFKVKNTGTASATNVDFVVRLPSGLRFNASDNRLADYNPSDHTVTIGLAELPVGQTAPFELTVLPVERGPQVITLNVSADLGATTEAKGQVVVEGLAELAFTVGQDNGTIETGASTTYSVQVTNIGNNPDKDVRVAVLLPTGAELIRVVEAPVDFRAEGNQIVFAPIPQMGNKDQQTFRFEVRHTKPGTQIVRTQITSANWPVAVVKEEGTLVYDDQN